MRVAIQQPEHLPWMGFFNKMLHCDLFVYLDNVQFKRRYFENRNKVKTPQGERWLTVPLQSKGNYKQHINQMRIDNRQKWKRKYLGTLQTACAKAPFGKKAMDIVAPAVEAADGLLVDLNLALIESVRDYLEIGTETLRASSLGIPDDISGSDLILAICDELDAETYLSGPDGRTYLDSKQFGEKGIALEYHDYEHPAYEQITPPFVSHMSVIDLIANHGRKARSFLDAPCGDGQ